MLEPLGSVPRDGTRTLITFSMRRSTAIAIVASLLVHLLALVWVVHKIVTQGEAPPSRSGPLVARLQPRAAPAAPAAPAAQPEPPAAITPPRPAPPRTPQPRRNPAITQSRPTPRSAPPAVYPPPPPQTPPDNNPSTDMMADMRNRRAQREAQDGASGTPGGAPPGEDGTDRALRNFNSLTKPGISGIFTITSMGTREGDFTFNGWTGSPRNAKRESFHVDAGLGGNLELAMVREMIKLIRKHYSGDFQFESHRLNRIVTLSARVEDSAGLEEFMRLEFFGRPR